MSEYRRIALDALSGASPMRPLPACVVHLSAWDGRAETGSRELAMLVELRPALLGAFRAPRSLPPDRVPGR